MPRISFFYGIYIYMYWNEHNPPHFHAIYGEYEAEILITPFGIRKGALPPKALALVAEWVVIHAKELLENWDAGRNNGDFKTIEPLK
jgi:Domain of unknown function (DUF4160)